MRGKKLEYSTEKTTRRQRITDHRDPMIIERPKSIRQNEKDANKFVIKYETFGGKLTIRSIDLRDVRLRTFILCLYSSFLTIL